MPDDNKKAITSFKSGLNCAQAIVTTYSEKFNYDEKLAMMISTGFGGGMGRLQEKCGAITGAFMVLGVYNYQKFTDNKERKARTYSMVQYFNKKFMDEFGFTNCKELINCDLNTEEGQKKLQDENLHERVCEKCISSAIKILDEMIN